MHAPPALAIANGVPARYDQRMDAIEQHGSPPAAPQGSEMPRLSRQPMPLMPEIAILTTLALIAAPILLVAGTLAAAAKKRLAER
jgi:hypothetical protein